MQVVDELAFEKEPAAQAVHSRYSATVEYVPAGHAAQVAGSESSVMYCPGAHAKGKMARSMPLLLSVM